ncbi:unnamed protein product [Lactuca saligna]|uniref:Uncharacterized protein n=1 Tax=Lactuca saligna TaxID=75948 RepID=A0AA35V2P6_LACSI|nr:unnamed protein product [Lactuca saligna]
MIIVGIKRLKIRAAITPLFQSASSSNSDSESDDEAQSALELQTLETKLSKNPANYDAHVQDAVAVKLINSSTTVGQLLSMHMKIPQSIYPSDTDRVGVGASGSQIDFLGELRNEGAIPSFEKSFERGVSDYLW